MKRKQVDDLCDLVFDDDPDKESDDISEFVTKSPTRSTRVERSQPKQVTNDRGGKYAKNNHESRDAAKPPTNVSGAKKPAFESFQKNTPSAITKATSTPKTRVKKPKPCPIPPAEDNKPANNPASLKLPTVVEYIKTLDIPSLELISRAHNERIRTLGEQKMSEFKVGDRVEWKTNADGKFMGVMLRGIINALGKTMIKVIADGNVEFLVTPSKLTLVSDNASAK